ncbi:hypothetical protein PVK06_017068 [Gossypium arboreum]|uniref:Uncharacterized protein n=1 Tax=Gossypium arboreum TaxID=29729 RepID=A0ABR0Q1T0_GOSAR|nr:hypothetical protein PVK06_017068 [Gossypium arboreum]
MGAAAIICVQKGILGGSHPSYTFHSIWSSKGLLGSGLRWKVRSDINVVSDPMIPNEARWNVPLVWSLLSDAEAKRVLCIQLALSGQEDMMLWRGDNTTEYTVRSGYKFLTIGKITTTPTN